jgi:hypothetical protein
MRQPRFFLYSLLGVAIAAAGCSSEPMAPQTPDLQPVPVHSLTGLLSATLLQCSPQQAMSVTKTIGSDGGELWLGKHYLVVPKNALSQKVTITGEVVTGTTNSVRFYPEGLKFGPGTKLYLSYANCSGIGMLLPKKVVYVSELLSLLEILNSVDLTSQKMAVGDLRHFSRYAVAY